MKSSMNGSKPGYVSSSFWRRPRCTEDLTFDLLLGGILVDTRVLAAIVRYFFNIGVLKKQFECFDIQYWTAPAVFVGS